ncbi:MAG: HlyD family efflux transporter periplasmic adaptor subunit [Rhizobiales bacterium]|nr:HlyD family efflux transporter periplasmic adaptor subunit [Hyphomicrobiales bacterium]
MSNRAQLAEVGFDNGKAELRRDDAPTPDRPAPKPVSRPRELVPNDNVEQVAEPTTPPGDSRRRLLRILLTAAGILVVVIGSLVIYLHGGRYASTDDAYVQAAKLVVATDVSGLVSTVDVREGQEVRAGDVLFRLDPRQFEIALNNAKAQLNETALTIESMKEDYKRMLSDIKAQQSQVSLDQATFDRFATLVRSDTASRAQYDQARFTLATDQNKMESLKQQAQVQLARLAGNPDIPVSEHPQYQQIQAQVDEAQRQLDHSVVRAPFSGIVTQVDALQPGTYLVSQTAALTSAGAIGLVSNERVWVDAFMKETDLTYAKPGDPVAISVDTYPGRTWSGTVQSISPASASQFSVLPAQNASGNWVKVVQRIPVRISVQRKPGDPVLRSGMSVSVDIATGHRRSWRDLF